MIEEICVLVRIPAYILPRPSAIARELWTRAPEYLKHSGITAAEAGLGFAVATLLAFGVGVLFVHSRVAERSLYPYAIALKAVPVVALAPILVLWFGAGFLGKVVMAALVCFFPVVVGTTTGMRSVGREVTDLFASLGASRWQALWKLRMPSSMPQVFSALKVSATLSVVGAIVGELSGSLNGLGFVILVASYEVQTVRMFAAIVCASIIGIGFFLAVAVVERRVLFWHESVAEVDRGTVLVNREAPRSIREEKRS
jgi:NitT/TauT family transport system permease protein